MPTKNNKYVKKNYDAVRNQLREVYLFGCYSKKELIKNASSKSHIQSAQWRDFSKFIESLGSESVTPSEDLTGARRGAGAPEQIHHFDNKLLDFFSLINIDINTFAEWSYYLNTKPEGRKDKNIRIVNKLKSIGWLTEDEAVIPDYLKELEVNELKELVSNLEVIKNASYFSIPYYLLQKKIMLYLKVKKQECFPPDYMSFKTNHYYSVMDSEILQKLLYAIHSNMRVAIQKENTSGVATEFLILPLKIIHDIPFGRQYLVYLDFTRDAITPSSSLRHKNPEVVLLSKVMYVRDYLTYSLWTSSSTLLNAINTAESHGQKIEFLHGGSTTPNKWPDSIKWSNGTLKIAHRSRNTLNYWELSSTIIQHQLVTSLSPTEFESKRNQLIADIRNSRIPAAKTLSILSVNSPSYMNTCPVCEQYLFFRRKGIACHVCGWIYDESQENEPSTANGNNSQSLDAARRAFEEKENANPQIIKALRQKPIINNNDIYEIHIFIDNSPKACEINSNIKESVINVDDYAWSVSNIFSVKNPNAENSPPIFRDVEIKFSVPSDSPLICELEQDTHKHIITCTPNPSDSSIDTIISFKVSVTDAAEMIPWLRSFGSNIIDISEPSIKQRMIESWEKALEQYSSEQGK